MVVYFLQIADKTIIGLSAVYGLRRDAKLVGNQYSTIGAIGYYAQLVSLAPPVHHYSCCVTDISIAGGATSGSFPHRQDEVSCLHVRYRYPMGRLLARHGCLHQFCRSRRLSFPPWMVRSSCNSTFQCHHYFLLSSN